MSRKARQFAAALLVCMALPALAQQVMEVITLQHATVEQVLPSLRPLLEPGGTLTGQRGQLIVRASRENISDLRLALADSPDRLMAAFADFPEPALGREVVMRSGATADMTVTPSQLLQQSRSRGLL